MGGGGRDARLSGYPGTDRGTRPVSDRERENDCGTSGRIAQAQKALSQHGYSGGSFSCDPVLVRKKREGGGWKSVSFSK